MRAGVATIVLLLLATGVACSEEETPPGAGDGALVGVDWLLQSVTHDGETQTVPPAQGVILRFDDNGRYRLLVCNLYRGRVTTDGPSIRFSRESATGEQCAGRTGVLERQMSVLTTGRVDWSLEDGTLHLAGSRVEGEFVERDLGEAEPSPARILLQDNGSATRWAHRVGVAGRGFATYLTVQVRPEGQGPFRTTTTLVDSSRLDVTSEPVGDGVLVAGTVREPGTSVEYQGLPVGRFPIRTWTLGNGAQVFAAVVAPGGQLVVHDPQGAEVARSRPVSDDGP